MRSRAYASVAVNQIKVAELDRALGKDGVTVGFDIGKFEIMAVLRRDHRQFERPWRVGNPGDIPKLIQVLEELCRGRELRLAMEPSGVYGDALRQALNDAGLVVHRVSPKAAHDYAEIFDGAPSQHDGKDAAVIAELAALGKSKPWKCQPRSDWEQEVAYWVERLDGQQRLLNMCLGQLEGLLARYWPEATRVLRVSRGTLLRVLIEYGGPGPLRADAEAAQRMQRWGGKHLRAEKVARLCQAAVDTLGVRQGVWEERRMRELAQQAWQTHRDVGRCRRSLRKLAEQHSSVQVQAKVIGGATACVLWTCLGAAEQYDSAKAYRKAMGLNLVERSSGTHKGQLRISKRGHARVRRWLYLASLRLLKQADVRRWYEAKRARDAKARRAVIAVMRKLALALYHVGVTGAAFEAQRLFASVRTT